MNEQTEPTTGYSITIKNHGNKWSSTQVFTDRAWNRYIDDGQMLKDIFYGQAMMMKLREQDTKD